MTSLDTLGLDLRLVELKSPWLEFSVACFSSPPLRTVRPSSMATGGEMALFSRDPLPYVNTLLESAG